VTTSTNTDPRVERSTALLSLAALVTTAAAVVRANRNRSASAWQRSRAGMLAATCAGAVGARLAAFAIRGGRRIGPFGDIVIRGRHIHHYVPGLLLMALSGATAILTRNDDVRTKMAVPFGAGLGLTLDEAAMLLSLQDVYWQREGLRSLQITAAALLAFAALNIADERLKFLPR
jgi:uncharacterized membrane protein